jgi:RNA polymerase sigma-70 factor (ECF subfamily)
MSSTPSSKAKAVSAKVGSARPDRSVIAQAAGDDELVRRCNAGDELAFNEIVARHRGRLYHLAFGCLHDHADAEEIVDDTFVRAFRALPRFRGDSSLATWLYHIVINRARSRYRRNLRHRQLVAALDARISCDTAVTLADYVAVDAADPAEELERSELATVIAACVARLPFREQAILGLRGDVDRSYESIAATMGIKIGTVRSRLARARGHLRSEVDAICPAQTHRASSF